jgi:hypothetical protein
MQKAGIGLKDGLMTTGPVRSNRIDETALAVVAAIETTFDDID